MMSPIKKCQTILKFNLPGRPPKRKDKVHPFWDTMYVLIIGKIRINFNSFSEHSLLPDIQNVCNKCCRYGTGFNFLFSKTL